MIPNLRKYKVPRLRNAHLRLGQRGETIACALLKSLELDIILRNYKSHHGEIDIIARDGLTLCFIEVKTRRNLTRSRPADSVTGRKKTRILYTAYHYLNKIRNPPVIYRFDVVEIIFTGKKLTEARYWPNEFSHET